MSIPLDRPPAVRDSPEPHCAALVLRVVQVQHMAFTQILELYGVLLLLLALGLPSMGAMAVRQALVYQEGR